MPRFHFIKQLDSMQCGVACLAMVCRYYGKEYSLKALSHWCRPTSEGVSLHGISEAAGKVGMRTIYGRVSMEQLVHAPLPRVFCIGDRIISRYYTVLGTKAGNIMWQTRRRDC